MRRGKTKNFVKHASRALSGNSQRGGSDGAQGHSQSGIQRHPQGLKGKDIGMWYSRRGRNRREKSDVDNRAVVFLNKRNEENISSLLRESHTGVDVIVSSLLGSVFTLCQQSNNYSHSELMPRMHCSFGAQHSIGPPCGLTRNKHLDQKLKHGLLEQRSNNHYMEMLKFRQNLPSFKMKNDILKLIRENQVSVISGETGCGKTTQVSQFILDECIENETASTCRIFCTQPRRISAIAVAERVASERAEHVGESCGFQIRLDSRLPRDEASILYCTTGILLRKLINDPHMVNVSHILLDEIHERDLMSDFLLIIIKDLVLLRPNLKVVLMSATLNSEMFSKYFGNCAMLHIPGYTFPVKEYTLENILELTKYRIPHSTDNRRVPLYQQRGQRKSQYIEELNNYQAYVDSIRNQYSKEAIDSLRNAKFDQIDYNLAFHLIMHITSTMSDGAILVFMPGWNEISKLHSDLMKSPLFNSRKCVIIPLHSLMPTANQKEVFERPPPGVRKIIIATTIAETSITIDDVVYVVDCGKTKEKTYDVEANISCLQPVWVSKASAKQRRGRAGRVQSGHCFRLYTNYHFNAFQDYQHPEILRTPLEQLCLQLKILRLGRIKEFLLKAMQCPQEQAIDNAIRSLTQMRALDHNEELTALGFHLAALPVEPKVGRMILFGAIFSCLDPVLTVAASLDFKEPFHVPLHMEKEADRRKLRLAGNSKSDHIMLINAFKGWEEAKRYGNEVQYCWENFMSKNTLKMIANMKVQFAQLLYEIGFVKSANPRDARSNIYSENTNLIKAVLCAGLYPNVAKVVYRKANQPPKLIADPFGYVVIHPKSVNANISRYESQWLIYHEKMKTNVLYLYDCTMVSPFPLLFFGGEISFHKDGDLATIQVDGNIKFHSYRKVAELVKDLRSELDVLLKKKIENPTMELSAGQTSQSRDCKLLQAIVDLITNEEVKTKSLSVES